MFLFFFNSKIYVLQLWGRLRLVRGLKHFLICYQFACLCVLFIDMTPAKVNQAMCRTDITK